MFRGVKRVVRLTMYRVRLRVRVRRVDEDKTTKDKRQNKGK
jgi:hypothetical protein